MQPRNAKSSVLSGVFPVSSIVGSMIDDIVVVHKERVEGDLNGDEDNKGF